jgi:hypothetical protein
LCAFVAVSLTAVFACISDLFLLRPLQAPQLFLQFITRYMHWSGQMRCRVTTLTRYWTDGSNSADLINGFDQV